MSNNRILDDKINYDEIDEKCIDLIRLFNSIGLKTKFSCQGHNNSTQNKFIIMFEDKVSDQDIYNFLARFDDHSSHSPFGGNFTKWMRKCSGEIISNWQYEISTGFFKRNQDIAIEDYIVMKRKLY